MKIELLVRQGGKVLEKVIRAVQVSERYQMWSVAYKGERFQVLGGGSKPYHIVIGKTDFALT